MNLAGFVLNILLAMPPCAQDLAEPGYVERQATIAIAIASHEPTVLEAAALVTILRFESAGCREVHSGRRKGGPGEGLWQLEPGSHRPRPYSGLSYEATAHAAGEALWLWRHSFQCGGSWEGRFRGYAGLSCASTWTGARRRSRMLGWINHSLTTQIAAAITAQVPTPAPAPAATAVR